MKRLLLGLVIVLLAACAVLAWFFCSYRAKYKLYRSRWLRASVTVPKRWQALPFSARPHVPEDLPVRRLRPETTSIPRPVSITRVGGDRFHVCNYSGLWLLDWAAGSARAIPPPRWPDAPDRKPPVWNPTGVHYNAATRRLYVANYTGHNVLVFDATDPAHPKLAAEMTCPAMRSPENVDVTTKGDLVAVADYDAGLLFLFGGGGKLRWARHVSRCHGVAFYAGDTRLLASSLGVGGIEPFHLDGSRLATKPRPIEVFIWPTCLAAGPPDRVLVTDAHTGRLVLIDNDLASLSRLGANGPGPSRFDMPYGACWLDDGEVLVADTYKARLVRLDLARRSVTGVLELAPSPRPKGLALHRITRQERRLLDAMAGTDVRVFREGVDKAPRGILLPFVPRGVPESPSAETAKAPERWVPDYSQLASTFGRALVLPQSLPALGFGPIYFTQFHPLRRGGEGFLLVGSPTSAGYLLIADDGAFAFIGLAPNLWMKGDLLVGDDYWFAAAEALKLGLPRIDAFRKAAAREGASLDLIRRGLLPGLDPAGYDAFLKAAFARPESKALLRALRQADPSKRREAARRFLERSRKEPRMDLFAILFADLFVKPPAP